MSWLVDWVKGLLSSFLSGLGLLNKEANLIIIGLDNAGKSTLLHRLSKNAFGSFPPTERPSQVRAALLARGMFIVGAVARKACKREKLSNI